ncbi:MAG TPA: hypothetical protein VGO59_14785 [Verrucomicrobiae bacterium]|jgi:hypothetical protein
MKKALLILLTVTASAVMAQTESAGIPWTPVNLTGNSISVAVVDSYGNVSGSFVVGVGQGGTLWLPVLAGGGLQLGGQLLSLDGSGTNANYTVFTGGTNGTVMTLINNAPPVSPDGWPSVNWEWFWAGFGMFASFFGFTWALRFTKQIGRANPEP